jgi:hypothetical protein
LVLAAPLLLLVLGSRPIAPPLAIEVSLTGPSRHAAAGALHSRASPVAYSSATHALPRTAHAGATAHPAAAHSTAALPKSRQRD